MKIQEKSREIKKIQEHNSELWGPPGMRPPGGS